MSNNDNKVIFLMGPTAAGKTDLAIKLAQEYPIEIISVDSAMVYQGMDIGTGKPTAEELKLAPHYLIDIINIEEHYSVANFCKSCLKIMHQIKQRGNIPLLVGGTMMYFNALLNGLSQLPDSDLTIRKNLIEKFDKHGILYLHQKLAQVDPKAAARIKSTDKQRIFRALEVYYMTGKSLSDLYTKPTNYLQNWQIKQFIYAPEKRSDLHLNIKLRLEKMLAQGFVTEVENLMAKIKGLDSQNLPAMRCVGYRQILQYLQGGINHQEMEDKILAATRQLAKRQHTWLRRFNLAKTYSNLNSQFIQELRTFCN